MNFNNNAASTGSANLTVSNGATVGNEFNFTLAMLGFMMTRRSMKRAAMARLVSYLRSLSAGVN